jgi:hypothetical protein
LKPLKSILLALLAVIAFDALAAIASQTVGLPYAYAAFGSAFLYIFFARLIARSSGFWAAVLLGMAMGLVDASAGWAVSWAIGPGRLPPGSLTVAVWLLTAVSVVVLGAVYGLIGGGISAITRRQRAA